MTYKTLPMEGSTGEFDDALDLFFDGCQRIYADYAARNGFTFNPTGGPWRADRGTRYVKIVREGSVHCFVDRTNGDVLKSAGWNKPAKHARGNIFDESGGLKWMGPHGAAYLK